MQNDFIDALYSLEVIDHEKILGEFKILLEKFEKKSLLNSRYVSDDDFYSFLSNNKLSKIVKTFMIILHDKHMLILFSEIVKSYEERILNIKGECYLYITSSEELTKSQINEIEVSLKKLSTFKFIIKLSIDKSLLSGIIVRYQERYINLSGIYSLYSLKHNLIKLIQN